MKTVKQTEIAGINAVRKLRQTKLTHGQFFMINSNHLPPDHCYLEYPTGSIKLAVSEPGDTDFRIVRELDEEEARYLRRKFDFELVH